MTKVSEIKEWDEKTIQAKVEDLRKNYFELRMQRKTTGVDKPHMLKDIRKDIARCLTVLGSKQK